MGAIGFRHRVALSLLVAGSVVVASAPVTEAGASSADATAEAATVTVIGLREGAEGAGVLAVQQKLISFGYYVAGGADGHFGPGTTAALRKFQEQNGLNPTGVVTENTARYLGLTGTVAATAAPAASSAPASAARTAIRRRSSASAVGAIRRGRHAAPATHPRHRSRPQWRRRRHIRTLHRRAVKLVQRVNGLPETGVVDAAGSPRSSA